MKLKNITIIVTIPFFGSDGTIKYLNFLSSYGDGIPQKVIGNSATNRNINFEFSQEYQADDFISKLEKTFNPKFYSFTKQTVNKFDSDWEEYEYLLKNHDWHYSFNDDHRVYSGGNAVERQIDGLKKKLSNNKTNSKKAESLYKKYSQGNKQK